MSFLILKVALGLFTEVAALIHRPWSLEFGGFFLANRTIMYLFVELFWYISHRRFVETV